MPGAGFAFRYTDVKDNQSLWWLIVEPTGEVDLCSVDPGFEVDLHITASLEAMTSIWMGLSSVRSEVRDGRLVLDGDRELGAKMQNWLGLSPFAVEKKRVKPINETPAH